MTTPDSGPRPREASEDSSALASARRVLEEWPGSPVPTIDVGDLGALSGGEGSAFATDLVRRLATALAEGVRDPGELLDECVALIEHLVPGAHPDPTAVAEAWRAFGPDGPAAALAPAGARALGWMLGRSGDVSLTAWFAADATAAPLVAALETTATDVRDFAVVASEGPRAVVLHASPPSFAEQGPAESGDLGFSEAMVEVAPEAAPDWPASAEESVEEGPRTLSPAETGTPPAPVVLPPSTPAASPVPAPRTPADEATPEPVARQDGRVFYGELEDHDRDQPLEVGQGYTVALAIAPEPPPDAIAGASVADAQLFAPDSDQAVVELTVQLDTKDFEVSEQSRPLRVPRTGRSLNKARFDIVPLHEGPGTIIATLHREGNFIHRLTITLPVGQQTTQPVEFTSVGRQVVAGELRGPRELSLQLSPGRNGGYTCVVTGRTARYAELPIKDEELADAAEQVRAALMQVVNHREGTGYPFSDGLDVPEAAEQFALQTLAFAGADLFQRLFWHPAAGEDAKNIGRGLREVALQDGAPLKLQIVSRDVPVPWPLIYLGEVKAGAELRWENFLGMRCVMERIPFGNGFPEVVTSIASDSPELSVSLNLNTAIDQQMQARFVADQQDWWQATSTSRSNLRVIGRSRKAEVLAALAAQDCADQVFYLYCHATAKGPRDAGGIRASSVEFGDGALTLADLYREAPTETALAGNPLVFVNACESSELSPLFYDGFVPYFMAKGARGVIGTECKIPALFAEEWAGRFFDRFLDAEPLGEIVRALCQEFVTQHRNPLGLIYAVHCDGDTAVSPALVRRAG
ncbi:CHAT domain-containing protein [Geodermatophilus sp. URMC 64]